MNRERPSTASQAYNDKCVCDICTCGRHTCRIEAWKPGYRAGDLNTLYRSDYVAKKEVKREGPYVVRKEGTLRADDLSRFQTVHKRDYTPKEGSRSTNVKGLYQGSGVFPKSAARVTTQTEYRTKMDEKASFIDKARPPQDNLGVGGQTAKQTQYRTEYTPKPRDTANAPWVPNDNLRTGVEQYSRQTEYQRKYERTVTPVKSARFYPQDSLGLSPEKYRQDLSSLYTVSYTHLTLPTIYSV
eukprot:TRINITY_DN960_c0_g1_i2.p1 TRINITY_DN960_c0_g1~~TRINITY_DN960_c0_g1_i2.p1  ORF type:complete len:242 (-),score=41.82 TRINITY_DN960_c0_g1_i2:36-761(-)